jgi:hypothetical protein
LLVLGWVRLTQGKVTWQTQLAIYHPVESQADSATPEK